ncbi:MAG TPA: hypothetical protein DDX54_01900 [Rhodospirillaceae bacterium]|nr:hypothetical protein [Rhodospirillaceae bacterium]
MLDRPLKNSDFQNLRDRKFVLFYCAVWGLIKFIPLALLIYFFEYGIYLVIAYIIFSLEKRGFLHFRTVEESNRVFGQIDQKIHFSESTQPDLGLCRDDNAKRDDT